MRATVVLLQLILLAGLCGMAADSPGRPPGCPAPVKGIRFVSIPAGSFMMGSVGYGQDEVPVHEVHLDGFCMSVTEITQGQVKAITGRLPRGGSWFAPPATREDSLRRVRRDAAYDSLLAAGSPRVEKFVPNAAVWETWNGAVEFCNQLSILTGREPCYNTATWECDFSKNGFRLPTEAEWEYACRAGTSTVYHFGDSTSGLADYAWSGQKSEDPSERLVGQKQPNAWGLYDMHGNVWEWCNDWYLPAYYADSHLENPVGPDSSGAGALRVNRGGSRTSGPLACRSGTRRGNAPSGRNSTIGFRIVCRAE
jgi:formylglycine-generating enzyme required for sulfatase activity